MVTSILITFASSPSALMRMRPENPEPIAVKYSSSARSGRNVVVSHGWHVSKEVPVRGRSLQAVQGSSAWHVPLESFCGELVLKTEEDSRSIVQAPVFASRYYDQSVLGDWGIGWLAVSYRRKFIQVPDVEGLQRLTLGRDLECSGSSV